MLDDLGDDFLNARVRDGRGVRDAVHGTAGNERIEEGIGSHCDDDDDDLLIDCMFLLNICWIGTIASLFFKQVGCRGVFKSIEGSYRCTCPFLGII